jgi:Ca2+:H+ antiporter
MNIIFNEFELITLIGSVLIANKVSTDGQSNWLEGVQLLAVYVIIAISFVTITI